MNTLPIRVKHGTKYPQIHVTMNLMNFFELLHHREIYIMQYVSALDNIIPGLSRALPILSLELQHTVHLPHTK
jgi:hypothetical protein